MSWRGHMFGVAVDSVVSLEGCQPGEAPGLPTLRLEPARHGVQGRGHALTRGPEGRPDLRYDPKAGYFLEAPGRASFRISPGGDRICWAAASGPAWRWQRYLIGRVLPVAVTLLGREPVHASAVACGKGAVVLAGESGTGKSTLAAELTLAGCGFMADDVVALTLEHGRLHAHPGPGLMSLRRPYSLGEVVGSDERSLWVAVERESQPLPVSTLYLLEEGAPAGIASLPRPDPKRLLATSFNLALRDPARLARMLDVYAALAAVRVARLTVPPCGDFRSLAQAILDDLCSAREAA